jgi:CBS domain containing-hemolysin-like protein
MRVAPAEAKALWTGGAAAVAVLAALWQWRAGARARAGALPAAGFWIGGGAWIALGMLPGGRWPAIGGLLAVALLQWLRVERRTPPAREAAVPETAAAGLSLDDADRRLVRRLLALRSRRVAPRMLPLARATTLREDATLADALALLRASRVTKIPVLDAGGRHATGLIDGRDLLDHAFGPAPESSVREVATALPRVRSDSMLLAAVDALRSSPSGVVAVVDAAGEIAGFLSWDHLFGALLSRSATEVEL